MRDLSVRSIDEERVNKLIKEADPYLQNYIRALKEVSEGWKRLSMDALKKIRKLSKIIRDSQEDWGKLQEGTKE